MDGWGNADAETKLYRIENASFAQLISYTLSIHDWLLCALPYSGLMFGWEDETDDVATAVS